MTNSPWFLSLYLAQYYTCLYESADLQFGQLLSVLLVKKICVVGLCIGIIGLIVSVFAGEYFLTLFYTPDVAIYSDTLNWVMAAAAVRYIYIFLGTSLAAAQQFHIQTKIYASGLLTMLCIGYLLIDTNGLVGAGQAMFTATIVELILFMLVTNKSLRLAFSQDKVAR